MFLFTKSYVSGNIITDNLRITDDPHNEPIFGHVTHVISFKCLGSIITKGLWVLCWNIMAFSFALTLI